MPSRPDFSANRVADHTLKAKYLSLRKILEEAGSAVIGYSGGADSALLAGVARDVLGREGAIACLALGPSLPARERAEALAAAALLDLAVLEYSATESENSAYRANGADRCFHCKTDLFLHLRRIAAGRAAFSGAGFPAVFYGGNLDDTMDFRPGRRAAAEHGARAPLAEAGLSKSEVRVLSRAFGLPTAEKPAQPCLSSRIPYGSEVTPAKLAVIERGEDLLRDFGFRECRLRHEGAIARVEVPIDQFGLWTGPGGDALETSLRGLGFQEVRLDPRGLRSGNLNEALSEADRRAAAGG